MSQRDFNNIVCVKAHNQQVTNFCISATCIQLLCPDCIEIHNEFHKKNATQPQIQSLSNTKQNCIKKIIKVIEQIKAQISYVEKQYSLDIDVVTQQLLISLYQVKQDFKSQIDLYFETLQGQIEIMQKENILRINVIQQKLNEFHQIKFTLETLVQQLEQNQNEDLFLSIDRACRLDAKKLIDTYQSEVLKITSTRKIEKIQLNFNEQKLFTLKPFLEKIIYISQPQIIDSTLTGSSNLSMHSQSLKALAESIECSKISRTQNHSRMKTSPNLVSVSMELSKITKGSFKIDQPNTLNSNVKFLQFFVSGLKLLKVFNIDSLRWQTIELNQQVSKYHSSIITPDRFIYLIGGKINNQKIESSIIQYTGQKLIIQGQLLCGRYLHRAVYCKNSIYIIGGHTDANQLTKQVEKFNIKTKTVSKCTDCLQSAIFPICCVFQDRFIYKFSKIENAQNKEEFIERYDTVNDVWELIKLTFNSEEKQKFNGFNELAAAVQINQNNIFVFGGYRSFPIKSHNSSNCVSTSFLLTINENGHFINSIDTFPLPKADGFWDAQIIINNNKLYALQNMENPDFNVDHENRMVLSFDSKQWSVLQ